jgi:hypothetical protein
MYDGFGFSPAISLTDWRSCAKSSAMQSPITTNELGLSADPAAGVWVEAQPPANSARNPIVINRNELSMSFDLFI